MKAIAITQAAGAHGNIEALEEITLPVPVAAGHDLLVEVKAISVNPVDTKVRAGFSGEYAARTGLGRCRRGEIRW